MYVLVYGNDDGPYFRSYTVLFRSESLDVVAEHRVVSGDLVFDETTGDIVQDQSWLFPWERENENCYARRKMTRGAKLRRDTLP